RSDPRDHPAALVARPALLPLLFRERPATRHPPQHRQREGRAPDEVLLGHDRELRGTGDDPGRAEGERLRLHHPSRARGLAERVHRRQARSQTMTTLEEIPKRLDALEATVKSPKTWIEFAAIPLVS